MASGYGPPLMNFTPLAGLGETFGNAYDRSLRRRHDREAEQAIQAFLTRSGAQSRPGLGSLTGPVASAPRQPMPPLGSLTQVRPRPLENGVHVAESEEDVQRLERATGMHIAPDRDRVIRTVYGEAGNQGPTGQAAVANVVMNRAQQSGMTPTDVVMAKGQFEPWSDPAARTRMASLDPNSPEYQRIAAVVDPVMRGEAPDVTGGADHFYAPRAQAALGRNAPSWDDGTGRDIGDHRFFARGYRPDGPVQVAQADMPVAGAVPAGFQVPGAGPTAVGGGMPGLSPEDAQMIMAMSRSERTRPIANALLSQRLGGKGSEYSLQTVGDTAVLFNKATGEVKPIEGLVNGPKPTDDNREYQFALQQGYQGSFLDFQLSQKRAGAANFTNNVAGAGIEPEFNKKVGGALGERFDKISQEGDQGRIDRAMVQQLRELGGMIDHSTLPAARGKLAEYGIKLGNDIGVIEAYSAAIDKLTPQQRVPGSGPTSDIDAKMFKNALPRLVNTPEGNALILDTMESLAQYKEARAVIAEKAMTGDLTPAQAVKELRSLTNPNLMFKERLQQVLKGGWQAEPRTNAGAPRTGRQQTQQGQPVKVSTPDEARKLPSGTPIILPDGTEGRVP